SIAMAQVRFSSGCRLNWKEYFALIVSGSCYRLTRALSILSIWGPPTIAVFRNDMKIGCVTSADDRPPEKVPDCRSGPPVANPLSGCSRSTVRLFRAELMWFARYLFEGGIHVLKQASGAAAAPPRLQARPPRMWWQGR